MARRATLAEEAGRMLTMCNWCLFASIKDDGIQVEEDCIYFYLWRYLLLYHPADDEEDRVARGRLSLYQSIFDFILWKFCQ